jgi:hypothetical protein
MADAEHRLNGPTPHPGDHPTAIILLGRDRHPHELRNLFPGERGRHELRRNRVRMSAKARGFAACTRTTRPRMGSSARAALASEASGQRARMAASRIRAITSSGTGSGFNRRSARAE